MKKILLYICVACVVWIGLSLISNRLDDVASQCDKINGHTCTLYEIEQMR
jgi:hypothetical protein